MMAFMMVNNFRIQATITTLAGLPACLSRAAKALTSLLQRMAETVAIYKTARMSARPPQTKRLPRCLPLSFALGATPTRGIEKKVLKRILGGSIFFLRHRSPNQVQPNHQVNPDSALLHPGYSYCVGRLPGKRYDALYDRLVFLPCG